MVQRWNILCKVVSSMNITKKKVWMCWFRDTWEWVPSASKLFKGQSDVRSVKANSYKQDAAIVINFYKSLVRPHVEYCVCAWSPHYVKDKHVLERIQHRFTKLIPGIWHLPYTVRLSKLNLWTLEERRNTADFIPQPQRVSALWPVLIFIPLRVDVWVGLNGWLQTEVVCPPADSNSIPVLTGPGVKYRWLRPTRYH